MVLLCSLNAQLHLFDPVKRAVDLAFAFEITKPFLHATMLWSRGMQHLMKEDPKASGPDTLPVQSQFLKVMCKDSTGSPVDAVGCGLVLG